MNIKKLKKEIDKHQIISFDIFDTLLLRPYIKPVDLFFHLEKNEKIEGFAQERIDAEKRARQKYTQKEDITFDEIYTEIDSKYLYLKDKELAFEFQVLQPNSIIKEFFDYAIKTGKKVIITSDMYLSKIFLEEVLAKNGYDNYSELYLSSEIGKTKWSGNLFKHIMKDLDCSPKDILHIGDNKNSDYKTPKKLGISSFLYLNVINQYKKNYKNKALFEIENSLGYSILLGVLAIKSLKNDYSSFWEKLGYEYGGITCFAYMKWLESQVKKDNIEDILFVARDGYSLKKVFDTFGNNINTHYIYAPRFINLICTLNHDNNLEKLNLIISHYSPSINVNVNKFDDYQEALNYFEKHKNQYQELAKKELENYRNYILTQNININKSCSVDSFSWNLSAQKLIKQALNVNLMGYYWQTSISNTLNYSAFFEGDSKEKSYFRDWNFMEFLMTAPEFPIINLANNKPVYKEIVSKHEEYRKEIYPSVSKGILDFANDIKKIFTGIDVVFENMLVADWINLFADYPTKEEKKNLYKVKHAIDYGHNNYIHLFPSWYNKGSKMLLFGFLPIGKIKRNKHKVRYYLLGVPVLKKKYINNNIKYYLFNFIYFLKIKGVN